MANENKKNEQQPENTPAAQVELNDEDLKQVTGGGIKVPQSPDAGAWPPGPSAVGPTI